jgi:uncharacterized membrane protein
MTQINILITEIWQKGTWNLTAVVVLVIIGVAAGVAAIKLFRWE